ncbi:redox-regulated ATPase YchF [Simkania negevensis]|uniref:Ribosome-binding ATPase YchF n=1 Tax=Simkania negevensis (strain ATCC VR-1471 / DSM 27360 / Z) TaxID=331113 RepID=F8L9T8_SIMNZ|nr:redox-regulated ATPase YchF [Simkania negevensis]CCB89638.1 GTP-dependent nucleic acid-binding protein engD [Simkania negevensis Z]
MSKLSCGIVGLPNVGKSTLFNALLKKKQAGASNYPFCTIDPNVGIVDVPDNRLEILSKITKSRKIIPAVMTFVDIAGLVKGASQGEGLGNKFLANIRETDVIIHVVRCFENDEVIHVEGKIDPLSDIEVINLELILADMQMAENSLQKLERQAKGNKELIPTVNLLKKILVHLNENKPVRSLDFTKEEQELLKPYHFITAKEVIYVTNVSEADLPSMDNQYVQQVKKFAANENSQVIPICAKLEEELVLLEEQEAQEYLESLELNEPGLNRLIRVGFETLGLITFLTTGEQETRAWTIRKGTLAQEAAGAIHTDIQKGFIRAEVVTFDDMVECQGRVKAKEQGKARMEGKDYIVQDGDVILFFHN